ncbi:P1 family peptidase [Haloechinothrix salitolerans]|uniref:P1 family peptidase n=1 Tax=Haloechinothrix salitolerans TaxID=926830 RepID=A0ABW2C6J6_9PSEU
MSTSGPRNAITDVDGLLVGHHHRIGDGWATGTTVVLASGGAVGGVDARGGAPGTRETDLLAPENMVRRAHAVCLSGGSAYGLASADGVMRWLSEQDTGFPVGVEPHEVVPIVPGAVIFDLPQSEWGNRPDAGFGYAACDAASVEVAQGCVGAGAGAKVGSLKGGVGTASVTVGEHTVGALAVVNAHGEAVDLSTGRPWAADHELAGEFGMVWPNRAGDLGPDGSDAATSLNTTIGVVATDAELSKAECRRLAMSAQDGLARAVRPAHSMFDGDTVFALATGARELPAASGPFGVPQRAAVLDGLCAAAATSFARAVVHGVLAASSVGSLRAYGDVWPEARCARP